MPSFPGEMPLSVKPDNTLWNKSGQAISSVRADRRTAPMNNLAGMPDAD
jgi:hypothetical protein